LKPPIWSAAFRATRNAFGLESVQDLVLEPRQLLNPPPTSRPAPGTLANIRLWDSKPLLAANRQLQQLRLYYTFPSVAVDRYALGDESRTGDPSRC